LATLGMDASRLPRFDASTQPFINYLYSSNTPASSVKSTVSSTSQVHLNPSPAAAAPHSP
ncbi:hypothetical protein O181_013804, partial [Austropuccinia psidii MF-1]|nr:hypothetical protein [Austropuccinia psidii MF-1]